MGNRYCKKLAIAAQLGATHLINVTKEDLSNRISEITDGKGIDMALETSGAPVCFLQAVDSLAKGGKLSVISFYESELNHLSIDKIVEKELTISGAFGCYGIAEATKNILEESHIDLTPIITYRVSFEQCLDVFLHQKEIKKNNIKVMVHF